MFSLPTNKRRYQRVKLKVPIVLAHNQQRVESYTYDVSPSGISIFIEKPLKLFGIYTTYLDLANSGVDERMCESVSFETVVVRSEKCLNNDGKIGYKISLFLFCIGEDEKKRIHALVDHFSKMNKLYQNNGSPVPRFRPATHMI